MKLIPNLAEIDRKAVMQVGLPADTLMETAGGHVADAVVRRCHLRDQGVMICGPGNNGGDGFVCARKLHQAGFQELSVIYTGRTYKNETLANLERLMGFPVEVIRAQEQPDLALKRIRQADFIVDALFGSGLARPVEGLERQLIEAANARRSSNPKLFVLAVDLPSGVDGATGQTLGCAVRADETVTFAAAKPGLYLYPGKAMAGEIHLADIGIPPHLLEEDDSAIRLMDTHQARQWLPKRDPALHKYQFGNVLVIAGCKSMPGAAVLTGESALRSGAGLVTLAVPASVFTQVHLSPELLRLPLPESESGGLSAKSLSVLQEALGCKRYHAIAIGPGLGQDPETVDVVQALLQVAGEVPLILDADGLNALSRLDNPPRRHPSLILTPHSGEAARLLKLDPVAVDADRLQSAQLLQSTWSADVVLKSASTVIASRDGQCWISPLGNSGMATAGSGDVLTGIIAGLAGQLHAQGREISAAAPSGVYLHGLAGDLAAADLTEYVLRASDITAYLPHAFKKILHEPSESLPPAPAVQ